MRYGFVIDHRRCIGCHACTVACKEENRVPLGAFRTWVKYVEKGTFPDTRRYFSVLRCNHCDDAPCVTICPTVALYHRADGIVDFDRRRCIGCKSCMQACPYDALYIDPDTNTAAKCHYCAHRVEVGLEPACVIVCPEQAIIAGDLDDPRTPIARLVALEQVDVRKPEQGTRPKVFYVGAEASTLTPTLQRPAASYVFGQRPAGETDLVRMVAAVQREEPGGDGALSRTVYDAPHAPRPWGWRVSAYLWTKAIASGALLVGAGNALLRPNNIGTLAAVLAPIVALLFLLITTALLVLDLKRPDRFHYILLKGNPRSWLVWGAWILIAYGGLASAWLVAGLTGHTGWLLTLAVPAIVLAAAAAGYSAFLFGQAEGRDFWQSPLHLPHLLAGALVAGSATLTVLHLLTGSGTWGPELMGVEGLRLAMAAGLLLHAGIVGLELFAAHPSVDVRRAARLITHGGWRSRFWGGVVITGIGLPLVLVLWGLGAAATHLPKGVTLQEPVATAAAAILALIGLWIYEDLWVKAGQSIPLS
ncbi:MAG TPA: 4Fe-4S dicluster domain-containing protein [Methylomirabilota bacterium]|nr:4Fe-4S dicluster domain-containing protein [Methylomirabilota bacterium]